MTTVTTVSHGEDEAFWDKRKKYSKKHLKFWSIFNIVNGIFAIVLQLAFYALNYTGAVVYISVGFWGGTLLIMEGVTALKSKRYIIILNGAGLMLLVGANFMIFYLAFGLTKFMYEDTIGIVIISLFSVSGAIAILTNTFIIKHVKVLALVARLHQQKRYLAEELTVILKVDNI